MKQLYLLTALFLAAGPTAHAVDLNKDALKSMQQEGERLMDESKGGRAYKMAGGHCLDVYGPGLVLQKCNAKINNQKWRMDDQQRLVGHDGRCVAGAKLQKCGKGKNQKWKLDGKKRLANNAGQCLQAQGNPPKAGSNVTAVKCNNSKSQVWSS